MTPAAFLNNPVIGWLPVVFWGLLLALGGYCYVRRSSGEGLLYRNSKTMIRFALVFYLVYPMVLMAGLYYAWLGGSLSKALLNLPVQKEVPIPGFIKGSSILQSHLGYFIFYSYGRFWINSIIAVLMATLFYLFLKFLRARQKRFFEEGEVELGFLSALIVGWPRFVVFIPAVFIFVVIISLVRLLFLKENYTTLGYPFLAAAFLTLILGTNLVLLLNLSVLNI